jgi:hypothetical protein
MDDIEFAVPRTLSLMAGGAAVIRALETQRPDHGKQMARAPLPIARGLTARARHCGRNGFGWLLQEMLQRSGPSAVHGGAGGGFDRFQIETALPAEFGERELEQAIYFVGDFLTDGVRRFFSWDEGASSTGRRRQILSLTSTKSRLIC